MDEKIPVIKKVFEDVDVTGVATIYDEMMKQWAEELDKSYFEHFKATEQVSEAVLLMNPKHKEQLGEFLNVSGLKIPIIWHRYVEEDKAYMVTDKELARNIRETYAYDNQRLK